MKSNIVFYINNDTIKFLQATAAQKTIIAADIINIDKQDDRQISKTLAAYVKRQKLSFAECKVVVLIPRSRVILRSMTFPTHKEDEIRSMIDLQVANHTPYARQEVDIGFQVLSKTPDGHARVMVVIVPQDITIRYWKIFNDAKIPIGRITVSSVGLWLLYRQMEGLAESPSAIFDLDLDHTEICLCNQTQWVTSRQIPLGLRQIEQGGCEEILNQWDLTQNNIQNEFPERIGSVYLVSANGKAGALAEEMSKLHQDVAVKEVSLTKILNPGWNLQWPLSMTDNGVSFGALAGIATSANAPPIDLIPSIVKEAQQQRISKRQVVISGIWLVAGLVSLGLVLGSGFLSKKIQLARLDGRLRDIRHESFKVEDNLRKIDDITSLIKGRLIFADLANQIYRIIPPQIYLTDLVLSGDNTLSLEGMSATPQAISRLQKNMVVSIFFSNVSLDYVNKRVIPQGEVDYFKISSTLNSVNGQK